MFHRYFAVRQRTIVSDSCTYNLFKNCQPLTSIIFTRLLVVNVFPDSQPQSTHLATFARFIDLPIEVRCMIWNLAVEPRLVSFDFWDMQSDCAPFVLLACKESRATTLPLYQPITQRCFPRDALPMTRKIPFHNELDVLICPTRPILETLAGIDWGYIGCEVPVKIKHVGILLSVAAEGATYIHSTIHAAKESNHLRKLETITVLAEPGDVIDDLNTSATAFIMRKFESLWNRLEVASVVRDSQRKPALSFASMKYV